MENTSISKAYLLIVVSLFLGACVPTQIKGFKDPSYQSVYFKRPLVCVSGEDVMYKQTAETDIANAFRTQGIDAGRCIDVFLPTRTYNSSDTVHLVSVSGYDSVIFIRRTASTSTPVGISGGSSTNTTAFHSPGYAQQIGNFAIIQRGQTTYQSNTYGYSDIDYKVSIESAIQMYDANNQQMVWTGSSRTTSHNAKTPRRYIDSFADALKDELVSIGLIQQPNQPQKLLLLKD